MRSLLIAFVVVVFSAGPAAAVSLQEPVTAPVVDGFRAPANQYSAGNRGWEYAFSGKQTVMAPAAGTVTFAGQVGGVLNVVIEHLDGVRTTLSKLTSIDSSIRKGTAVEAGQVVGAADGKLFFGVRCGDQYIDPSAFVSTQVHLVDTNDDSRGGATEAERCPTKAASLSDNQRLWLEGSKQSPAAGQVVSSEIGAAAKVVSLGALVFKRLGSAWT